MKKNKPELVSPAGNWTSLLTAIDNGADSVYFGIRGFNMRERASNFEVKEFKKIMQTLHKSKKKGYLALNVIVMNEEIRKVKDVLLAAKGAGVDAVILWDMAVLSLAEDMKIPVHLSTQASVSNEKALHFYSKLGVKRIIPARECTISDIKRMVSYVRKKRLKCEIETFIHGAMCLSISGRCFLSSYSFASSANKGKCLQPCRREFLIKESDSDNEYILGKDYILSPRDLCTIDFIDRLIEIGIDAFKIEGRMRSPEYNKTVTSVYREAIDLYFRGGLSDTVKKEFKEKLKSVYTRGFSEGFYFGAPAGEKQSRSLEHKYEKKFLGIVKKYYKKISVAEVLISSGRLKEKDALLFMGENTPAQFSRAEEMQQNHAFVKEVRKGDFVGIKVPFILKKGDKVYLWQEKNI